VKDFSPNQASKKTGDGSIREDWVVARFRATLRERAAELSERYSVKALGVFGAYVRNEQKKGSDLDILVEFHELLNLLKFVELENYLSDLLGVKVDLVMKSGLKPGIGKHIMNEVVPL